MVLTCWPTFMHRTWLFTAHVDVVDLLIFSVWVMSSFGWILVILKRANCHPYPHISARDILIMLLPTSCRHMRLTPHKARTVIEMYQRRCLIRQGSAYHVQQSQTFPTLMLRDIKERAFPSDVISYNLQHLGAVGVKEDVLKFFLFTACFHIFNVFYLYNFKKR